MTDFIVTFDDGTTLEQTIAEVYQWREDWKPWEKELIQNVLDGKVRRFSTSKDGIFCDIERRVS